MVLESKVRRLLLRCQGETVVLLGGTYYLSLVIYVWGTGPLRVDVNRLLTEHFYER